MLFELDTQYLVMYVSEMNFFQTIVQHLFKSTIESAYRIKMITFLSNFDFKQFHHCFVLHSNDPRTNTFYRALNL